ncbi:acyl carrier protein [Marinomonas posidonica]|uniref:Acyl carrier protein n=1 Tax=Marinomonas posidonica (strain CECT 7376 / NCIMB 14433 / IVIA-Po-181) TaxID=491952 RepID=F6CZV5_MARPP|nr:acyl carrier protein [Marinomonas posidonica]AEF53616.1 Acyl carrier protein [Marinomonas posidonica IVIA-Po-181]
MNQQAIYQRVSEVLQELFELLADDITPEANLYQDLDIDSIDAVDLIVELKKMTGKKLQPEDFKAVRTVQDVVVQVEKLMAE